MLNIMNYLLVKQTFWDQIKEEFREIIELIKDFFEMIKSVTYDLLANAIGGDYALLLVITVGVIGVMIICLAVINR
ncbi:MAG: hypothetical protein ACI4XM_08140 [Candidatus Coprovivens sp.]